MIVKITSYLFSIKSEAISQKNTLLIKRVHFLYIYSIILLIFASSLHKYTNMSTKKERLDASCHIIQSNQIGNQEELLKELENKGFIRYIGKTLHVPQKIFKLFINDNTYNLFYKIIYDYFCNK